LKHSEFVNQDTLLLRTAAGEIMLPAKPLIDRADGGHLVVLPAREVWDRTELSADELAQWSALVAACAWAMLQTLPQLKDGCINYWDAGNWALNDDTAPAGRKVGREHRKLHMHVIGRSPDATDPAWRWGESPLFPRYAQRLERNANYRALTASECEVIVSATQTRLREQYYL
jgi:diadenosine tetraphosphate (Ap4A) HIT family hydrolase